MSQHAKPRKGQYKDRGACAAREPTAAVVVAAISHLDGKLETSLLQGWFRLALLRAVRARWRTRRARSMLIAAENIELFRRRSW